MGIIRIFPAPLSAALWQQMCGSEGGHKYHGTREKERERERDGSKPPPLRDSVDGIAAVAGWVRASTIQGQTGTPKQTDSTHL